MSPETILSVYLRPTRLEDLDFVLGAERNPENAPYVAQWSREEHAAALTNPDIAHRIIEINGGEPVGYLLIAGLKSPQHAVEFRRVVIVRKGLGIGRSVVRMVQRFAFKDCHAHRLWLDVRDHNLRAQELYASEGFIREGLLRECNLVGDHYESLVVMSILDREYTSKV